MVHTIGGFIALAGAIVLGPRLGRKFKRDGGGPMLPHDLTIAACGGLLLWFGWYGFNPGSTLSAMDFEGIGRVAANTTLAACAAGLTAMAVAYSKNKTWDISFTVNGFLAGPGGHHLPVLLGQPGGRDHARRGGRRGGLSGRRGCWNGCASTTRSARCRCTAFCGIWGTLSLGLFACGKYGATGPLAADNSAPLKGLFYGGGTTVLAAQAIGSLIVTVATFAVAMAVMYAVNAMGVLRVSAEGETHGLDLHEHGISAYPEYVISLFGGGGGGAGGGRHPPAPPPRRDEGRRGGVFVVGGWEGRPPFRKGGGASPGGEGGFSQIPLPLPPGAYNPFF